MRIVILILTWLWAFSTWGLTPCGQTEGMSPCAETDSVVVAENFQVMTADGRVVELDSLPKGRLTILVFFDPDCSNCRQALFGLRNSSLVSQLVNEEVLQVMTVHVGYVEQLWRDMLTDIPETWVRTTQMTEMRASKCYDLSSLPALYLLDADKKIMARGYYAEQLTDILAHLW